MPLRVFLTAADSSLGEEVSAALRAAGHDIATAESRADAMALLDDASGDKLVSTAESLVGRTAALLDAMPASVKRVVVATGADVYGEGPAECTACGHVRPENRPNDVMAPWEPRCPRCEGPLTPAGIREEERVQPATPLSALRLSREDLLFAWGRASGLGVASLRMFEVYGPRVQKGAMHAMAAAIRAKKAPELAEDGLLTRDFIHVRDAAKAVVLALTHPRAPGQIFNVGSGKASRLSTIAAAMVMARGEAIEIKPSAEHRRGEPRHLFAETMKIRHTLGWKPEVALTAGVGEAMAK
ncbi:MAG: NAD-dependent epimerase/dehydratase family protein [Planctomycetota bacterium]